MTDGKLSRDQLREIFERDIRPLYFPEGSGAEERPTLLLLGGQPGAGKSRATALLQREYPDIVVLSGDDLRPFHPDFLELVSERPVEAPRILAEATAVWVREAIAYARDSKTSLMLEGTFHTPDVVHDTARRFDQAGFRTHVVVLGTPRHESLLSATSRYLLDRAEGRPGRFTSLPQHDRGWEGTQALINDVEQHPAIDQVTVINRAGDRVFDARRQTPGMMGGEFAPAAVALIRARSDLSSTRAAAEWLGELRRVTTEYVKGRDLNEPTTALIVELHREALQRVIPAMSLPEKSPARAQLEQRTKADLAVVKRVGTASVSSAPHQVGTTGPGHETPGPSR